MYTQNLVVTPDNTAFRCGLVCTCVYTGGGENSGTFLSLVERGAVI